MYCVQPLDSPFTPPRRIRAASRSLALTLVLSLPLQAVEPIKTYSALTLKDGRHLTAVQIIAYTANGVLVRHADAATTLRTDVLPEQVVTELHLPRPQPAQLLADNPAFLALADKVAVAETAAIPGSGSPAANEDSNVTAEQARAAALASSTNATHAPAGEGSHPNGFMSEATPVVTEASTKWITFAGRVAVTLPSGETHLLSDVEVRAYPADLLARYLVQARAKSARLAQQLHDQAAGSAAPIARATPTAEECVDLIPVAPYATRSDAFGHFTLRHDLREPRLVAVGRIKVARGEWTYAWIGIAPGENSLLTEANATAVSAPLPTDARLAAQ